MIQTTITHHCTRCQSTNIVKNGHNTSGNPQFKCKDCGRCSVLEPSVPYTEAQKQHIIDTYLERGSLRAMQRLFGVSPNTLSGWLKKKSQSPLMTRSLSANPTTSLSSMSYGVM